jgi:RNA polymerase sigma-70 factor (ECF subfamily)
VDELEDAEAVMAFHAGDGTAFQILFDRHATHVYRTAYFIVLDRERAEDIAQEAFLTLFQRLPRLAPGPLGSWLDRVAVNLSLNERRRTREILSGCPAAALEIDAVSSPVWPAADVLLEAAEERDAIWATLTTLTRRQRAMVVMRFHSSRRSKCRCTFRQSPTLALTIPCNRWSRRVSASQSSPSRTAQSMRTWSTLYDRHLAICSATTVFQTLPPRGDRRSTM